MERQPIPSVNSPLVFTAPTTVKYQMKGGPLYTVEHVEKVVAEIDESGEWLLFKGNSGAIEDATFTVVTKENVAELWRVG